MSDHKSNRPCGSNRGSWDFCLHAAQIEFHSLGEAATSIIFVATKVWLSRQTRVCRDNHTFVATKITLVAAPAPDSRLMFLPDEDAQPPLLMCSHLVGGDPAVKRMPKAKY